MTIQTRLLCVIAVSGFVAFAASAPAQVRHVTDRAIRIAVAGNAVSTIVLPKDIQDTK